MKLLLDANLSPSLTSRLRNISSDIIHVRDIGLRDADDDLIWQYAKSNNYIIVSKDSDFYDRIAISGYPPKFIWIRLGNCSTNEIEKIIRDYNEEIISFCKQDDYGCLILR